MAHPRGCQELLRHPQLRLNTAQAGPQSARRTTPAVRGSRLAARRGLNSYDVVHRHLHEVLTGRSSRETALPAKEIKRWRDHVGSAKLDLTGTHLKEFALVAPGAARIPSRQRQVQLPRRRTHD